MVLPVDVLLAWAFNIAVWSFVGYWVVRLGVEHALAAHRRSIQAAVVSEQAAAARAEARKAAEAEAAARGETLPPRAFADEFFDN